MRQITQAGLDLIKRFEGFSPTVYICPAGYPTMGYGYLVSNSNPTGFLQRGVVGAATNNVVQ